MELIKTIRDIDFAIDTAIPLNYKEREAARAVVFDDDKNVALLHVTKKHYHKLPGGGLEENEDIETALRRELQEEIGCSVSDIQELGVIEEYRDKFDLHQVSYCFIANLSGDKGVSNLEDDEIADGFESMWVSLEEAIKILESEIGVEDYEGKFIRERDLTLLKKAAQISPLTI